ncbi:MAG: hypothetical protein ACTTIC_06190 [Helicobacteraceae bacterium]
MVLMDKLQMMVKLKEKICSLKETNASKEDIKKFEDLLKRLQVSPNTLHI